MPLEEQLDFADRVNRGQARIIRRLERQARLRDAKIEVLEKLLDSFRTILDNLCPDHVASLDGIL